MANPLSNQLCRLPKLLTKKDYPKLLKNNFIWLGFQMGAASLWLRAGLMPRPRMRACKVAEGHLAASLLSFLSCKDIPFYTLASFHPETLII